MEAEFYVWLTLLFFSRGALEEEKTKCQHLSELLERERAALRQLRSKVDQIKLESDSKDRHEYLLEVSSFLLKTHYKLIINSL